MHYHPAAAAVTRSKQNVHGRCLSTLREIQQLLEYVIEMDDSPKTKNEKRFYSIRCSEVIKLRLSSHR